MVRVKGQGRRIIRVEVKARQRKTCTKDRVLSVTDVHTRMLCMTWLVRVSTRVWPSVMKISLLACTAAAVSDARCSETTLKTCGVG